MDIFWVFIIIFGIIVSIGQKTNKRQITTEESEPASSPEQEMERRLRELLEGKTTPPARPMQGREVPPLTQSTKTSHTAGDTHPRPILKKATKQSNIAHTQHPLPKPAPTKSSSPIKDGEIKSNEIGQIVKDFTIDKAVIYAEIMKPKYEEY